MPKFYRLFLILILVWGNLLAQTPQQLKTLDSAIVRLHEIGMFNGVVLYAENGKIKYQKALGIANHQTQEKLNLQSAFNLASVSKQFIGMMVMILQEQNKLKYDDLVQNYLPDFPYSNITIRHLLTHTSGLPEYFDLVFQNTHQLDTLTNPRLIELLKEYKPALVFQPGEKWEYCNTGYVLLASIIEKAAKKPIQDFFREKITTPLGLKNTYAFHLKMGIKPKNRVFGFQRENGKNQLNDLMRYDGVIGDGNIYSSAEDLLKWEQALYTDKLLKIKTLQEAFTPVKLNNGTTYPYGFGWGIDEAGKKYTHTGGWVGFLNIISRDVEKRQTLIILSNSSSGIALRISRDILQGKPFTLPSTHLIRNVRLIDGTGTPARPASIRLRGDKIWEVGDLQPFTNETVTDGKGMVLAPGFIDSHSHHGGDLAAQPEALAPLNQGITTIVSGQDGGSTPIDSMVAFLKRRPVAVNWATYTGHSTLRMKVMGVKSLLRTAKTEEVEQMKTILRNELSKGSLGLATGLEYESAFFSNRNEVLELAKVLADSGGRYISHIRSEDINLDEAIDEIIQIGKIAKIPVKISHFKIALREKWGTAPKILAQLQQARNEGVMITADCYPYDFWLSTLRVLFPKRDYTNLESAEFAVKQLIDPEKSILAAYDANPTYAQKSIGDIARLRQETPAKTLMALVADAEKFEAQKGNEEAWEAIMGKSMTESDVIDFLTWGHTNICSDGFAGGHPRGYGAFARVLGKYVREQKIMNLETAIYKMTGLTAEHLGIKNRGIITPNYFADLVLFNPETVKDNATIQNPTALSTGIELVWVNGEIVYQNQKATGKFSGRFLKR
jgi:N-acyl-D-amino-acid deacylase